MPHFAVERCKYQFAGLKDLSFFSLESRKEVKEPSVPCGVSFPLFFPLVERKEAVGDIVFLTRSLLQLLFCQYPPKSPASVIPTFTNISPQCFLTLLR